MSTSTLVPVLAALGDETRWSILAALGEAVSITDPGGRFAYAWLRDGSPIGGAGAATYRVGTVDLGHRLSVRVVANGETPSQPATSAETAAVAKGRFTSTSRPTSPAYGAGGAS